MAKLKARAIPGKFSLDCGWISKAWLAVFLLWGGPAARPQSAEALYQGFRNPPRSYSLMPYWYWNGRVTAEQTRREIQAMISQGVYQCIMFPWDGMEPRYLSEEYFRQVGAALDAARELGFTFNLADECDWPSGHAWDFGSNQPELSRVLHGHPEYRMRRLDESQETISGEWHRPPGVELAVAGRVDEAGKVDAASLTLLAQDWRTPEGRWVVASYRLAPAVGGHNTRVDLLNPDAVRRYIALVYEEYARRFPQHLGKTLRIIVADHEGAYGVPIAWTPQLWDEFRRRKGYDLRRVLPLLTRQSTDGARARSVRQHYLDVVSQLYVDSFTRQVDDWCARHGILHATSAYEEQMYIQVGQAGDMFRLWRSGSAVEIDALLERARMPVDFKEAVSVAHFDRKRLIVENQGLQGHATFFSLEKARLGTNMALLWGANLLVPYFDYDPKNITWPPQWFLGQPFWRYFHHYAELVRRAQYMNAQGTHVAPVALYYPLETAFASAETLLSNKPHRDLVWNNGMDQTQNFYSALQLELARQGWDYHVLDREYLNRAGIRDGALRLADEDIRVLILPPMTEIAPESATKLRRFVAAGGTVLALGRQPVSLEGIGMRRFPAGEHPLFMDRLNFMQQISVPEDVRADLAPLLAALRRVVPPQPAGIYVSRRRAEGVDWYWVVNDSENARSVAARIPGAGRLEKWDAETGERTPLCESDPLRFDPWDAYFVVRMSRAAPAPCLKHSEPTALAELPRTGWRFTPESPEVRVPYGKTADGKPVWLAPERLSNPNWWLAGPFPFDDHKGFYATYPPERGFDPAAGWKWFESPAWTVTIRDALPQGRGPGIYYAFAYVHSPREAQAEILTAFAGSMRVWWNGEEKLTVHRHPKWLLLRDAWAERAPIEVRRGWNTVLLKIGPSLMVPTAFMFRIVDGKGATMRDLVYAQGKTLPLPTREQPVTVEAPPGAQPLRFAAPPEHPVAFRSRTVPFTLESWTGSALAWYSGTANYERSFDLPAVPPGARLLLDLGAVGVAAEVWVNGRKAGERAWRPFRFDITGLIHPGANQLRIRVANSDAGWQSQGNTIYPRGSWGLKYQTELDRLPTIRPNGLEGPVRILTVQ